METCLDYTADSEQSSLEVSKPCEKLRSVVEEDVTAKELTAAIANVTMQFE